MRQATFRITCGQVTRFAAVLLASVAWPAWSATHGGLVPQYSEDLRPTLTASKTGIAKLEFDAFGRGFRLKLWSNERLARVAATGSVQLYRGNIQGVPGSWARIAVLEGLPRGMIWDGRELYVVDAAPEGVNDGAAGTVMFKLSDAVLERSVSFAGDTVESPRDAGEAYDGLVDELRGRSQVMKAGATQFIEVSILADATLLARYANETQARNALLTRLNNVDGIFSSQLGVELQVASVEIAGELAGRLTATTDSSTLLKELGQLRARNGVLASTGLTHLFTGRDLESNTAGIAYTLALCSPRYSASLTMIHESTALDTLTTAHEIGHVFGAPHDGSEKCAATPQGQYIMSPALDTSVTSFSQCSLDEIDAVLDSYSCLRALPEPAPSIPAPDGDGSSGGDGGGGGRAGGGGTLDPGVLALLLLLVFGRYRFRCSR